MGFLYKNWVCHLFLLAIAMLSGCTAIQPFPQVVRSGDTISLMVGSQSGMGKGNTQVWFTSDADTANPIDLSGGILAFFDLYADRSSWAYSPNNADADTNFRYLHHEAWQTAVALDLPLGLPLGPGTIQVQTTVPQPKPLEAGYLDVYPDINTVDIRMEILPGDGTPNPFQYKTTFDGTLSGDLRNLKLMRQALVQPPVEDPGGLWPTTFGAIEVKLSLPMLDADGLPPTEANVRLATQSVSTYTDSRLQTTWSFDGSELTVLFLSATGNIHYYEPRFGAVAEYAYFTEAPVPSVTSARYFDSNGNEVPGPAITDYSVTLRGKRYWTAP